MIQYYLDNVANLYQLTPHSTTSCLQHGDRIVTTVYCDITSPYIYQHRHFNTGRLHDRRHLEV